MRAIAIDIFVAAAVLVAIVSVLGMLRVRDPYQRMHYISPPASLSSLFIAIAVFLQSGLKPASFKAAFVVLILVGMNTIVTHSAARAFRISEVPDWHPGMGEEVPTKPSDERVTGEQD